MPTAPSAPPGTRFRHGRTVGRRARRLRRAHRGCDGRTRRGDRGTRLVRAGHADGERPPRPGRAADHGDAELRRNRPRVRRRRARTRRSLARRRRADRRVHVHHPVELPAAPDDRQGGTGARRRLHDDPQAEFGDTAQRVPARRDHRQCGPPRRGVQPRHRSGAHRRRSPLRPPGGRHDLDHRLDRSRRPDRRAGRPERQAHLSGTGWQVGERDPRRSRPGQGGSCRYHRDDAQLRPDLHGAHPHDRAARASRTKWSTWRSAHSRHSRWATH